MCLSVCVCWHLVVLPAVLVWRYFRINASANFTHFPLVQLFRSKVFGIFENLASGTPPWRLNCCIYYQLLWFGVCVCVPPNCMFIVDVVVVVIVFATASTFVSCWLCCLCLLWHFLYLKKWHKNWMSCCHVSLMLRIRVKWHFIWTLLNFLKRVGATWPNKTLGDQQAKKKKSTIDFKMKLKMSTIQICINCLLYFTSD